MAYNFELVVKEDEDEVKKLYDDHSEVVEEYNLYSLVNKFFRGDRPNLEAYKWMLDSKIVGCFTIHYKGDVCIASSGLCHMDHRGNGFLKQVYNLQNNRAKINNMKSIYFAHCASSNVSNKSDRIAEGYSVLTGDGWDVFTIDVDKVNV